MSRRSLRINLSGTPFSAVAAGGKDRLGPVPWVNVSLNWRCASIIRIDSLINLLVLSGIGFTLFFQKCVMCLFFHHFVICSILDSRCPLNYAWKASLSSKSTAVGKWPFKEYLIIQPSQLFTQCLQEAHIQRFWCNKYILSNYCVLGLDLGIAEQEWVRLRFCLWAHAFREG